MGKVIAILLFWWPKQTDSLAFQCLQSLSTIDFVWIRLSAVVLCLSVHEYVWSVYRRQCRCHGNGPQRTKRIGIQQLRGVLAKVRRCEVLEFVCLPQLVSDSIMRLYL